MSPGLKKIWLFFLWRLVMNETIGEKMEQDFEWILGSKSRIFGNPVPARAKPVYVRTGLSYEIYHNKKKLFDSQDLHEF